MDSHYKSQVQPYIFVRFLPHPLCNVTIGTSLNTKELSDMKQKQWKSVLKPLTFLPVIFMLCTIFGFSNQNAEVSGGLSQKVSRQVVTVYDSLFHQNWDEEVIEQHARRIEYPIRKAAHVTEYLILTLLTVLPLSVYGLRGKKLIFVSFLCCILSAAGDEFHQSFIPGRSPQFTDVLVDSIGILIGCGISCLFLRNRPSRTGLSKQAHTHK